MFNKRQVNSWLADCKFLKNAKWEYTKWGYLSAQINKTANPLYQIIRKKYSIRKQLSNFFKIYKRHASRCLLQHHDIISNIGYIVLIIGMVTWEKGVTWS